MINAEIANLRDLLPLPPSTRQRLSQLQLMALVCVYVRKANYFQQVFKRHEMGIHHYTSTPNFGFSKALSGFLMMMTQHGKLLYISDNAAEYLGHSMEDLLIHGDSVYDMIDKQDHQAVQNELVKSIPTHGDDERLFLCRMNVSRNARRQMRFGDQKVILVQGHYLSYLPLCSRNEPVFLATCTPIAMPETRECVVQGATNVFTTIHSMDMKFVHIDRNGEFHLGFQRSELQGVSWYQLLHWENMREAQNKHRLITQSEQDRSCILLIRMQKRCGNWLWIHCVLQVKDNMENNQTPIIVSTNQVLSEREALLLRSNSWLYNYYMVQNKLQYGLSYEPHTTPRTAPTPTSYYQRPESMSPFRDHHHLISPYHQHSPHHQSQLHHQFSVSHLPSDLNYRYGRRLEPEPVDYSVHSVHDESSSAEENRPPFVKRETIISVPKSELSPDSPSSEVIVDLDRVENGGESLLLSTISSLGRSRVLMKAATTAVDPADFMDQWNPSPPWSDTTMQKVPDILHQDLSPHVTTTPPTPGSNSSIQHSHSAFSFDWTPEQYVPNIQTLPRAATIPSPLEEEHYPHILPPFPWPTEHRLFPLQPPPVVSRSPLIVKVENDSLSHRHIKDHRDRNDDL